MGVGRECRNGSGDSHRGVKGKTPVASPIIGGNKPYRERR